jgi:hypothetical protein
MYANEQSTPALQLHFLPSAEHCAKGSGSSHHLLQSAVHVPVVLSKASPGLHVQTVFTQTLFFSYLWHVWSLEHRTLRARKKCL